EKSAPQIDSGQEAAAGYRNRKSAHRATLRASYLLSLRALETTPYLASGALIAAQLQLKLPIRFGVALGYETGNSTSQKVISQVVSGGAQLGYSYTLTDDLDLAF